MKNGYRLLRVLLVTVIMLVAVVPAALYVALSLDGVQRRIADEAEKQLSELLDARVTIGRLGIMPFNRVILRDVTVETAPGDTALTADRLGVGVAVWDALLARRWRVDYVALVGADVRLSRDSVGAPLNIQPIIDALSPKDRTKPPTRFDLQISTVIIRSSEVSYDVRDREVRPGFDPNHVDVRHLRADINLPKIKNDDFTVNLRRLAFDERSGLAVRQLSGQFHISAGELAMHGLDIEMPGSRVRFADMALPLAGLNSIGRKLRTAQLELRVLDDSHVWLPDFAPLCPVLGETPVMAQLREVSLSGSLADFNAALRIDLENMMSLSLNGHVTGLAGSEPQLRSGRLKLSAAAAPVCAQLRNAGLGSPALLARLETLGEISLEAAGKGSARRFDLSTEIAAAPGRVNIKAEGSMPSRNEFGVQAKAVTAGPLDLVALLSDLAPVADGEAEIYYGQRGPNRHGTANLLFHTLRLRGTELADIGCELTLDNNMAGVKLGVNDADAALIAEGEFSIDPDAPAVNMTANVVRFVPSRFGLGNKYPGAALSGRVDVDMHGASMRNMEGYATISDLTLKPVDREGITMNRLHLVSRHLGDGTARIDLSSDWVDGTLYGEFDFPFIAAAAGSVLAQSFPALLPQYTDTEALAARQSAGARRRNSAMTTNDFLFDLKLKESERLAEFFKLPLSVIYPVTIKGGVSQPRGELELNLSAPYLRQGNKLIENTSLSASVSADDGSRLNFKTTMPTKGGPMTLQLDGSGHDDMLRSSLRWNIDRERAYNGYLRLGADFQRDDQGLLTTVDIRKSQLTFNDTTWTVDPARITVRNKDITVDGLHAIHENQYIKIDGKASPDPTAMLTLDLQRFSLDYLFESLGIDAVMLGGKATGQFYASDLFSGVPVLETPGLNVKNISYNSTILGDALVKAHFEPKNLGVILDADIDNGGRRSTVEGGIYIKRDSLDLTFRVDREPVGFLQPYMEAFASDIRGYASGWARVFGNFKYIDLEGDVLADSVSMKVNFTNTTYWATDSVHITPGRINLKNITLHDHRGHTARLNGKVLHTFFKEPRFEFSIQGARDLLCYNETAKDNPRWYGRIYGDGNAYVKGVPGRVDINVDMTTAPNSTFTFVLSDQVDAEQFSFLTFRDKKVMSAELTDTLELHDTSMDLVNRLRALAASHDPDTPSDYNITIQMGVTPDAEMILVMDPLSGDRIRASGTGHIRMDYGSANNELKMYGNYTLDRGDYNFTLQDIIIKDFTIRPGSEISFSGDPYAAKLDIKAAYTLNANLSDLDESFLNDSELQRTNVPVNALMNVTGDIAQPEVTFDLEFPTLTSDIYRKVRSIISTDEMMNRQMLYLLALNRFYTPDYMTGATRGNELVSVASSTLSSQLSNILGQISDNWNIAPALRSSRGDFSDVEVDVALSSRLLNNRLLFNGNFGYRDKSLNSNQFIGDFDLEYLLNRKGTIRLKAYNRYNDQNYYLRSALTTQGVGIVLRKDFDSLTSFFKPVFNWFRPKKRAPEPVKVPLAPVPEVAPQQPVPVEIPEIEPAVPVKFRAVPRRK